MAAHKEQQWEGLRFHYTIYSGLELRDRMERAGFADVGLHGNLRGDAYGPDSERLIAVGHKPLR